MLGIYLIVILFGYPAMIYSIYTYNTELMNPKTIYFVRHGESVDNIRPIYQRPDAELSPDGLEQAEQIAARAENLSFEIIISSTLRRAYQTAEAIQARTGKPIEPSELLVERVKPTAIYGKDHSDPESWAIAGEWSESMYISGKRVQDGENFDDIMGRVDQSLEFLKNRPESEMVVVTHSRFLSAMVIRVLMGNLISGEAYRRFEAKTTMKNTGITVLRYFDDTWKLVVFNDHSHLG